MRETIKININGQLFDLDNNAYERLKHYLDSLKVKFGASPKEAEEILEDIESRIAEILSQKINSLKQVVTLADIDEIISLMGTAEEMDEADEEVESENSRQSTKQSHSTNKRFYRDPQNSILGGVSSGIAAYFNIDPLWIRLIFIFLTFANLAGVLIYLIFWLVLQPAITTAQRLEMQGKSVNLNDIENSVKNEFEKVKRSVRNVSNSEGYKNAESVLSEIIRAIGKIIIVFLKVIGIIIGVSLLIALVTAVLGIFVGSAVFFPIEFLNNFHFPHLFDWPNASLFGLCLFLVIALPIAALLGAIIRLLFNIQSRNRLAAGIGATVWVVAFISLIVLLVVESDKDVFRESKTTSFELNIPHEKPLYIGIKSPNLDKEDLDHYQIFNFKFTYDDFHNDYLKNPSLKIKPSNSDKIKLVVERNYANLKMGRIPKSMNRLVKYEWYQKDTLLILDQYYSCDDDDAWRVPIVNLTLTIPEGRKVYLDDDLVRLLDSDQISNELLYMNDGKLRRLKN